MLELGTRLNYNGFVGRVVSLPKGGIFKLKLTHKRVKIYNSEGQRTSLVEIKPEIVLVTLLDVYQENSDE